MVVYTSKNQGPYIWYDGFKGEKIDPYCKWLWNIQCKLYHDFYKKYNKNHILHKMSKSILERHYVAQITNEYYKKDHIQWMWKAIELLNKKKHQYPEIKKAIGMMFGMTANVAKVEGMALIKDNMEKYRIIK